MKTILSHRPVSAEKNRSNPVLHAMIFTLALFMVHATTAQDNERSITGTALTSDLRAPFGDDYEVFNLGGSVNSAFSEYNPVVSPDGVFMLFTTRNDTTTGNKLDQQDQQYFEDINMARLVNSTYVAGKQNDHPLFDFASGVNSRKHEAPVYVDDQAANIILFKENDLWYSSLSGGQYSEPIPYPKNINFKYYHRHASLTSDGNTMVFAAEVLDKKLNRFHLDIFKTTRDGGGVWSKPERLPLFINSPYNEDSPEISPDGKLLFFSSDRNDGIGGYDVYYVELNGSDSLVHRLAEPINSPADDIYFKMNVDSTVAFLSSNRLGGYGAMDIYKIVFHKFNTDECITSETMESSVVMNGPDTVLLNGRLMYNNHGSSLGGMKPRTSHWYLNDSLVSVSSQLDMEMQHLGTFDLRLYMSVIDIEKMAFLSGCASTSIKVLEPTAMAGHTELENTFKALSSDINDKELLAALPSTEGPLQLRNDVVTTFMDSPVTIEVLKNDGVEDGDLLLFQGIGRPMHGSATVLDAETGEVIYHPMKGFTGMDAFSYRVKNPYGTSERAWVGVQVLDKRPFHESLYTRDDDVTTTVNTQVKIALFDNDVPLEGIRLKISATTLPVNGSLTGIDLNGGRVIYVPNKDFTGSDVFTYSVDYPGIGLQKSFVRVEVSGEQGKAEKYTAPDYAMTTEGALISVNVFLNDRFAVEQRARLTSISSSAYGASRIYDPVEGTIVYAPHASFSGYENLTYVAETADGARHIETVSIYVRPETPLLAAAHGEDKSGTDTASTSIDVAETTTLFALNEIDERRVDLSIVPKLVLKPVYFGFDKADIRPEDSGVMQENIMALKANPEAVIRIVSHCDSRGSKAYNMILSARRAKATVDYLVSHGIDQGRIVASVGLGEDGLINDCGDGVPCANEEHQQNRRSEFVVVGSLR